MVRVIVFTFFLVSFDAGRSAIGAQTIDRIQVEPASEMEFVLGTIPVQSGVEFRQDYPRLAEKFLRATNRYESIQVKWNEPERRLEIEVLPIVFFESVRWSADIPKGEGNIRSSCVRVQENANLSQDRINQISNCVLERVRAEGYLDAQAFVYREEATLFIELNQGESYQLESASFRGNQRKPASFLMTKLKNRTGGRYRPLALAEDTKKILRTYLSDGFFQAQVTAPAVEVSPATRSVKLVWRIREGQQTLIEFVGDYRSRRPVDRWVNAEESAPDWFLDEIQEQIRQELLQKGFLNPDIQRAYVRDGRKGNLVRFSTQRGRQYLLTEPVWVGLTQVEKIQKIYESVPSFRVGRHFYEEGFRKTFEEQFFQKLVEAGFQNVRVRSLEFGIDDETATVQPIIYMNEGSQRVIQRLDLSEVPKLFAKSVEFKDLKSAVQIGKAYNAPLVDELARTLSAEMRKSGYLDVTYKVEWIEEGAVLRVHLSPGPRYRIVDAVVRGLSRTKLRVIQQQFEFKKGDFYSQEDMNDTTESILRLGLARSIDIQVMEKDAEAGTLYLLIDLVEAARFRFEVGPGFGTADGLRGVFRGTYANIAGTGRRVSVYAKMSRRLEGKKTPENIIGVDPATNTIVDPEQVKRTPFLERRMTAEYFEPNLFVKSLDGRVVGKHELLSRKQFGVENYSITGAVDWRLWRFLTYTPSYKVEYSDPFNIQIADETRPFDDSGASRLHSIGQRLLFNLVDDPFNPEKGLRFDNQLDIYDSALGGNKSFWILNAEQTFYMPLIPISRKKIIGVAFSMNAGFSSEYRDTGAIPVDKRFRLGGESTVRGFSEDSIQPLDEFGEPLRNGGKSVFYFRSELNFPITQVVDLLGFFDGGTLYKRNSDFSPWDLPDLRYAAGAGLRFNTPVGPVKFGYAVVLDPKSGEEPGQIYFGVGPL